MCEVKQRLKQFIESQHLTTKAFEKSIGAGNGYVNSIVNSVGNKYLPVILEKYPTLDREWLLYGEGDMLKPESENLEATGSFSDRIAIDELREGRYRMVPLLNIDSVGGVHSLNAIEPSEQYVIRMMPFTEAREGDVAILQTGNSMSPTIPPGSALLIREVVDWREYFGYGNLYVLWLRDGRRITKEVRRYDADPKNYIWCVSYNPDVADEELPRSMIKGVWKVIKYIADFGW